MSPSRTRFLGMDVHKDAMAVAYVAQDHGAEVISLGTIGTRQCAIAQLLRQRPSQATHLVVLYEAGPCGSWLSRSLRKKDDDGWVVAPSLMPKKAGDRVTTDRRDAVQLARLARSGDLTAVRELVGCMGALAKEIPVKPSGQKTERPGTLTSEGFLRVSAAPQPRCGGTLDGVKRLGKDTRASREAGTRRMHGRWEPTHGEQQDHPSSFTGSVASDARRAKNIMQT